MKILKQLIAVELSAFASLLVVAMAMAAYGAMNLTLHPSRWLTPAASAQIFFGYTAVIGAAPALLLGSPAYLFLVHRNLARWPYVLLLGAAPGLLALVFDIALGFIAISCGAAVALLTHFICRRLGPNNSFKPTPHRSVGRVAALR